MHPSGRDLHGPTRPGEVWVHVDDLMTGTWAVQYVTSVGELQYHRTTKLAMLGQFKTVSRPDGKSPRMYLYAEQSFLVRHADGSMALVAVVGVL